MTIDFTGVFDDPLQGSTRLRDLMSKRQASADHILSGRITEWSEYQHHLGRFLGMSEAIEILTNKPQQQKQGNADGSDG